MTAFDSHEFRSLQRTWYRKLKTAGFHDIETGNKRTTLHMWQHEARTLNIRRQNPDREGFYQSVGRFLHVYTGFNKETRLMWRMFAEGKTYRQIREAIFEVLQKKRGHDYVFRKVESHVKIMLRNLDMLLLTDEKIKELKKRGKITFRK